MVVACRHAVLGNTVSKTHVLTSEGAASTTPNSKTPNYLLCGSKAPAGNQERQLISRPGICQLPINVAAPRVQTLSVQTDMLPKFTMGSHPLGGHQSPRKGMRSKLRSNYAHLLGARTPRHN